MKWVENTYSLHSLNLSPFLDFNLSVNDFTILSDSSSLYSPLSWASESLSLSVTPSSLSTPSLTVITTELVSAGGGTVDEEDIFCDACWTPCFTSTFELLYLQGLQSSGLQFTEIIFLELGHFGTRVHPILLQDICRLMQTCFSTDAHECTRNS